MSRINTNISSIQARARLATNQADLSIRLERLSSGLRINRGRDDPAGLIASESLRSEITGLNQSIENSSRATNVIATAEGSLNEVSSLLLEMRGLVNKSANEGALSPLEIAANQLQIDSILSSIDRIANTTQFNGVKLLNGSLDYTLSSVGAAALSSIRVFSANVPEGSTQQVLVELIGSAKVASYTWSHAVLSGGNATIQVAGNKGSRIFNFVSGWTATMMMNTVNNSKDLTGVSASVDANSQLVLSSLGFGGKQYVSITEISDNAGKFNDVKKDGTDADIRVNGIKATADGLNATVRVGGLDMELSLGKGFGTTAGSSTTFYINGGGALFQLGPDVTSTAQYRMGIQSIATGTLGSSQVGRLSEISGTGSASIVGGNCQQAQKIVDVAIQQVSMLRGRLGGFQKNQLETNINSQRVALENAKASESAIRDADYASETAAMTRAQILVQSTTQILVMANQQPQQVLRLLGQ